MSCKFRLEAAVALEQEAIAQDAQNIGAQCDIPNYIEPGVAPTRFKQALKGFTKFAVAEVIEIRAALRDFDQFIGGKPSADLAIEHRAKAIQRPDSDWWTETVDAGSRFHLIVGENVPVKPLDASEKRLRRGNLSTRHFVARI